MPRMSKRRKEEWALFLNDRNRITYNELCRKCVHDCIIPPCSKAMLIIPTKYIANHLCVWRSRVQHESG